jgi:hypothetical protein
MRCPMARARWLRAAVVIVGLALGSLGSTGCDPGCESDADCAAGQRCEGLVASSCQEPECRTDDDCLAGYECGGRFGETCLPTCAAIQCGHAQICVDDFLSGASCQPGCKNNEDCPAGSICPSCSSRCRSAPQCEPGCHDDGECGAGQFCRDGKCLTQCWNDSDCFPGSICNANLATVSADPGETCPASTQCICLSCAGLSVPACASVDAGTVDETQDAAGGLTDGG